MHIALVQHVGGKARQRQLHHVLGGLALVQQGGDGRHGRDVLFQLIDLRIGGTGQQLHHKAACAQDGQVLVHQHAQRHDGGHLLAVGVVGGQVLGDLAGDQRHLPHGRLLLQAVIPDDGEHTVFAHSAAHIQVAVRLCGQLHQGVIDAALHVAGAVGAGNDHARRAAAGHTQGDLVTVVLEHGAHQGRTGEQTAQCRAAGGAGGVQLFSLADDLGGIHAAEHDPAILRQAADQICHKVIPPIVYTA